MRGPILVFLIASLAGCLERGQAPSSDPFGADPDPQFCRADSGCNSGKVCARTDECLPPAALRAAHVMWTVSGAAANPTTCAAASDLRIQFNSADVIGGLGYAPVPCKEGKFSIDKLPLAYVHVWLGRLSSEPPVAATIDATTGEVTLDLPYGPPGMPGSP